MAEKKDPNAFREVIEAVDMYSDGDSETLSVQLGNSMTDVIMACQESGSKASLTLVITAMPGPDRRVSFTANVKTKLPRRSIPGVTLFADKKGGLHRSDPDQGKLALEAISINKRRGEDN